MPELRVFRGVHQFFEPQPRQRGLGDGEPANFLGMCRGVVVGDHHADVVADQVDLTEAEVTHQLTDVFGDGALVVAAGGLVGVAEPPEVGGDHGVAARQDGD